MPRSVVSAPAQRQAWRDGVMPAVDQVAQGLWSIPVPIPDNPLRYVLVYAFETPRGLVLVDAGWNTETAWQALVDGIAVTGHAVGDVETVLVTHIHPDHYGLAGRVREASGARVALHPADAALIPGRYGAGMDEVIAAMRELLAVHGVPADVVHELSDASVGMREFVDAVTPDVLLNDGDRIEAPGWDLSVIHTPGHSPGHVCFHERSRRLLLSGDHVLPRISPNITFHTQSVANPLADFLEALARVGALDIAEVLPAHEWRFRELGARVEELTVHHARRLDQTRDVVAATPGITCWDVTQALSWSRGWDELSSFMRRAAVGETLAHLVLLESRGRIRRTGTTPIAWAVA